MTQETNDEGKGSVEEAMDEILELTNGTVEKLDSIAEALDDQYQLLREILDATGKESVPGWDDLYENEYEYEE